MIEKKNDKEEEESTGANERIREGKRRHHHRFIIEMAVMSVPTIIAGSYMNHW